MEPQSIVSLLSAYMYVCIFVCWILDLEGEMHSIWDLWISGLKNAREMVLSKSGGADRCFRSGPKNLDDFLMTVALAQKARRGRCNI